MSIEKSGIMDLITHISLVTTELSEDFTHITRMKILSLYNNNLKTIPEFLRKFYFLIYLNLRLVLEGGSPNHEIRFSHC